MMEVTRATRAITASRVIEISAGIISTHRAHEATLRQKQHHPDQRLHGSPFEPAAACRSAHSRSGYGVSRAPGFLSATLHRSIDGTKVTMYAKWRSAEDYHAMRQDPAPLPFLEEALSIAKFEPGIYEVVRTFSPSP
jgi:heme-degrading monooxygenase HmoA